jgi:hypothetical protein
MSSSKVEREYSMTRGAIHTPVITRPRVKASDDDWIDFSML